MNIHAPNKEIQERFKCLDWRGRRFKRKGKTYIRGKHRTTNQVFYFCFEEEFAWFPGDI